MNKRSMFWNATRLSILGAGTFVASQSAQPLPQVSACAQCFSDQTCRVTASGWRSCVIISGFGCFPQDGRCSSA